MREPQEGDWPVIRLPEHPFIDPSITKLNDLPEWLTGKDAFTHKSEI